MRREVPEDVDVALDQAKVDPDRVEKLKLAEHPGAHELADALDRGRVAVGVVAHQHDALLLGRVHEGASFGVARCERLLDQNVLARFDRGHRDLEVGGRRRSHRDRFDAGSSSSRRRSSTASTPANALASFSARAGRRRRPRSAASPATGARCGRDSGPSSRPRRRESHRSELRVGHRPVIGDLLFHMYGHSSPRG